MSLCFDEAYQALKAKRISEQEYLHEVLAHFVGVRHPADEKLMRPWELMISDPVGNAIREAALNAPSTRPECKLSCILLLAYSSAHDTSGMNQLEKLFASTLVDDVTTVQTIVKHLTEAAGLRPPVQAIATFAALHSDVEVLRLCLRIGASLEDRNTSMALEYAARGPALLDLLYEYNWRGMREYTQPFNRMLEWSLHTGPEELLWFLNRGVRVDKEIIRRAVYGPPVKVACIEVLLQHFGVDLFKGTRLLQSAAKRGCNDIVKLLLEAGVDVDDMSGRNHHDEGECELTALVSHQAPHTVVMAG